MEEVPELEDEEDNISLSKRRKVSFMEDKGMSK